MYNKRLLVIVGFIGLSVAALFLFVSSQAEHRQRIQKDKQLQEVLAKLSNKDAEIAEIQKQWTEEKTALNEKITSLESSVSSLQSTNASLEASLKAQEENLKQFTEKNEKLLKDREALMQDNLENSQAVTTLEKKITVLNSDRQELLDKIKGLEQKQITPDTLSKRENASRPLNELRYDAPPKIDSAKLGKVLVQKSTGRSVQVQHVNDIYQFVVINAGSHDGLRKGSVINVIRADQIIAKAIVEKLKPDLSAAILVPESILEPVQPGDFVTQF